MEDQDILDLYEARSEQALLETEKKYGRYCFTIAHHILQTTEDSEECVNDTWLRTWQSIPPQRPKIFSAFLAKITRNRALDLLRGKQAEKRGGAMQLIQLDEIAEVVPDHSTVESVIEGKEISESMNRFLEQLTTEKRIAFLQRYFYMCSIQEISEELDRSESSVRMMLMRIRQDLRNWLEKEKIEL